MKERNSKQSYVDCVWFKEKGTLRFGNALHHVPENSLFIISELQGCYGKDYKRLGFFVSELDTFKIWMSQLSFEVEQLLTQSGQRFKTMPLNIKGHVKDAYDQKFSLKDLWPENDWWKNFLGLAFNFELFCKFFPQGKYCLGNALLCEFLEDFLQIFSFEPLLMRRPDQKIPKNFRRMNRFFCEHRKESIKKYVMRSRLCRATYLLSQTNFQLSEVAWRSGFLNHAYFSAKFKKEYAVTPRTWREKYQPSTPLKGITQKNFNMDCFSENTNGYISAYNSNA